MSPLESTDTCKEAIAKSPSETEFFSTSTSKLVVMSICTFGFYELYWFYKNWTLLKEKNGENIMPFWRAVFAPLWAGVFFKRVQESADKNGIVKSLPIVLLGIVYFILQGLVRLPDPYWLVSSLSFAVLIPINSVAFSVNKKKKPDFVNNDRFTRLNWAGVILGGMMVFLNLYVATTVN